MISSLHFIIILVLWNIFTLLVMGIDKYLAINHRYRVDEKTLFLLTILFGAVGIFCGMYIFRHKTNHQKFKVFIPFGILINIAILLFIYW